MEELIEQLRLNGRGQAFGSPFKSHSLFTDLAAANVLNHAISYVVKRDDSEAFKILYKALKKIVNEG